MTGSFALVIAALLGAGLETANTASRFEAMAKELKFFPTRDLRLGWGDALRHPHVPEAWMKRWYEVHTQLAGKKDAAADVIALLKHKDPKVRTLALAALFDRQDPKHLPNIAAMTRDKEKTLPDIQGWGGFPPPKPILERQTVGDVAQAFLEEWIGVVEKEGTPFKTYWDARKERKFCASWFLMRIQLAARFSSHVEKDRAPLIRSIRKEIDALPAVDRDWTLIWLASHRAFLSDEPANNLVSPEERIAAGKRLGPVRLMDLIHKKAISDDPDLSPSAWSTGRGDLMAWVLGNAGKLLRREDAAALLIEGEKNIEDNPGNNNLYRNLTRADFIIGAAELQPEHARHWLRKELKSASRTETAAALWRLVGESEIDYLADWFYGLPVNNNSFPGYATLFLREIKDVHAPADRKLVARLVNDKRFGGYRLDYQSDYQIVRGLIETVNRWTKMPVVSHADLHPRWEHGGWSPGSERDEAIIAEWRTKLKKSQVEWKK